MSVREVFWLVADHHKRHPPRTQAWAGKMTDSDVRRAEKFLREAKANGK